MKTSLRQFIIAKIQAGATSPRELEKLADHAGYRRKSVSATLTVLVQNGQLIRPAAGMYTIPKATRTEPRGFEQIAHISDSRGEFYRLIDVADFLGVLNPNKLKVLVQSDEVFGIDELADGYEPELSGDYVSRKGLNRILLKSRAPQARAFREWLGDEVLESAHEVGIVKNPTDPGVQEMIALLKLRDEQATQRAELAALDQRLITVENQAALEPPDLRSTVEAIVDNYQPATEAQLDTLDATIRSAAHGFQDQAKAANRDPLPPQREFINAIKRDIKKHVGIGRWEDMTYAQAIKAQRMADNIKGRAFSHKGRKFDTDYDQVN